MTKDELIELLRDVPGYAEIEVNRDGITYDLEDHCLEIDQKTNTVTIYES